MLYGNTFLKSRITSFSILIIIGFLNIHTIYSQSKTIPINPELENNSDRLKVKLDTQWGNKIPKIKFGDYRVVDSQNDWMKTKGKSNFWNTRSEYRTEHKFSFVLNHIEIGSVIVNTLSEVSMKEVESFKLFSLDNFDFYVGPDDDYSKTQIFTSEITSENGNGEVWSFYLAQTENSDIGSIDEGFLAYENRFIFIKPISSNKNRNNSLIAPDAYGYEFFEHNKCLGAVQCRGRGISGNNKKVIWIKSDLEPKMKLILAAAMTVIIHTLK
ncbi:hypothetical protein KFZ70_12300 [Tamlana fucoidanivorans]|uniref:Uncharacterized protein n=1 Tax=Allotamlana fucoidanivorans TaxID=2583814 RepID=A0A5C4SNF4_9FLAO|nr:hypothetical protein [Tamlana fucoidanivorans]TNJ44942.1 hypothetical protein FGF67_07220 [Tamlana fucoidanivorans]